MVTLTITGTPRSHSSFFQAEDGIRAATVTGVQTCALPISERLYPIGDIRRSGAVTAFGSDWPVSTPDPFLQCEVAATRRAPGSLDGPVLVAAQRSEERRVGKGWRWWLSAES